MENQEQNPSGTELEAKLEQLNRFTRRTLTQEEVFLFDVRLCDNEIDRDGERFSLEALEQLKALFVGKTGIFDHDPKGENQTARIYAAGTGAGACDLCRRSVHISERACLHGTHRCQSGSDSGN